MYHPAIQLVNPGLRRLSTAGVHWLPQRGRLEHLTSLQLHSLPVEAHRWPLDAVLPSVCSEAPSCQNSMPPASCG